MKKIVIPIIAMALILSCSKEKTEVNFNDLKNLPIDTGGVHLAVVHESTNAPYGYYLYTPSGYDEIEEATFPLLIFLHGSGEKGNSSNDPNILDKVLRNGPPKLIENEQWSPTYPMLVVSPQCHDGWWDANKIQEMIDYSVENYKVNTSRIYLTGLSMGGYGTFNYLTTYGNEGSIAAAVPICGSGNAGKVDKCTEIPIWAFHGDADKTVDKSGSINFVEAYNSQEAPVKYKARLTIYPGVGHDSWSRTYDGNGMGTESPDYDAFYMSIYDWMFQYERAEVSNPVDNEQ